MAFRGCLGWRPCKDLSGRERLDSRWIDHLILLRFHFTVNCVTELQDKHLQISFPFFFLNLKWLGLTSILMNLSGDKHCIFYYCNVILVLNRRNYRINSAPFLTWPRKPDCFANFELWTKERERNFAVYKTVEEIGKLKIQSRGVQDICNSDERKQSVHH